MNLLKFSASLQETTIQQGSKYIKKLRIGLLLLLIKMEKMNEPEQTGGFCRFRINAVKDSMDILTGKWKIHILGTLLYGGKMRYMDLQREVGKIGSKMLSKELQDLEMNHLIVRIIKEARPVTVEYELTDYGKTLEPVINAIAQWGMDYRRKLFGKNDY